VEISCRIDPQSRRQGLREQRLVGPAVDETSDIDGSRVAGQIDAEKRPGGRADSRQPWQR
jgi:hypothetical protein